MFTGTFENALDVLRTYDRESILKFMHFMDAHPNTVGGWLLGTSKPPTGETKIRALSFFKLNGWLISDFEKLDSVGQNLALLLGFRVATLANMLDNLGLASSNANAILGYLYGEKELTKGTSMLAKHYVADQAPLLAITRSQLETEYLISTPVAPVPVVATPTSSDPSSLLASLLIDAYPLAVMLNSDDFSNEQRAAMRKLIGDERYLDLSVTLNQMRSTRTREQHRR
jgi:hypothetical protein